MSLISIQSAADLLRPVVPKPRASVASTSDVNANIALHPSLTLTLILTLILILILTLTLTLILNLILTLILTLTSTQNDMQRCSGLRHPHVAALHGD